LIYEKHDYYFNNKDNIMTVNVFLWEINKDVTACFKNAVYVAKMCKEVPEVYKFPASCTHILV
jgi:hypothetical protein